MIKNISKIVQRRQIHLIILRMVTLEKKSRREEERGEDGKVEKVNQGFNANEEQALVKVHHIKTAPSSFSPLPPTEEEEEVYVKNDKTAALIQSNSQERVSGSNSDLTTPAFTKVSTYSPAVSVSYL